MSAPHDEQVARAAKENAGNLDRVAAQITDLELFAVESASTHPCAFRQAPPSGFVVPLITADFPIFAARVF